MSRGSRGPARSSSRRGQALVEFALVAPMFFLLLFGIIEAGRFIFYYETLNNATREGARYAIVNGANSIGCPTGPAAPGSTVLRPDRRRRAGSVSGTRRSACLSPITVDPVWHDRPTTAAGRR